MPEISYGPLYGVPVGTLDDTWEPCWKLLKKAHDRMGLGKYYSEQDLLNFLKGKEMQLWIAVVDDKLVAAFITQILEFPQSKSFDVLVVGGSKMSDWVVPAWETFKEYARSFDCDMVRGFGRDGWTRTLPDTPVNHSAIWEVDL